MGRMLVAMAQRMPWLIGHRGAPAYLPEHTAASYALAISQGADAVEPDLVPSADGVLVVRHEPLLDDTTDVAEHPEFAALRREATRDAAAGWYAEDFTWAQLQTLRAVERLPELRPASAAHSGEQGLLRLRDLVLLIDEAATARGRDCTLVLELKWDAWMRARGFRFEELLVRELEPVRSARCLQGARIESFEVSALDRLCGSALVRELDARLVVLVEDEPWLRPGSGEEGPERCTDEGLDDSAYRYDGISVRTTLLDADLVDRAHERGLEVFTYTLRAEAPFVPPEFAGRPFDYWRALAATGVDGVFADDPGACRAAHSGESQLGEDAPVAGEVSAA